mgnify:FL=1|tara:strand:- start:407 stop:1213 length:807 start_codon:yes stop_codon:yes gene_type:complete
MAWDKIEVNHLDVFNSIVGGGLVFPAIITDPGGGVFSAHKGHFGQGSSILPFSASLVAGPLAPVPPVIPSPLTWNFLGMGLETGVRNVIGADIKIGTDVSLGVLACRYNALSQEIVGKKCDVTPAKSAVAPSEKHIAAAGKLLGGWVYNGLPLALLHTHSDARLKKNIEPIPSALTKVLQLNPVYYEWRKDILPSSFIKNHRSGRQIGLIAQEVEKVVPELVKDEKIYERDWKGINYEKLTALLIGAVKEQQVQIEELQERISVLESK